MISLNRSISADVNGSSRQLERTIETGPSAAQVSYWHVADLAGGLRFGRYWVQRGRGGLRSKAAFLTKSEVAVAGEGWRLLQGTCLRGALLPRQDGGFEIEVASTELLHLVYHRNTETFAV